MAGQWLGVPPGWSVPSANGRRTGRRFVVKAPNNRRWESSTRPRCELIAWAKELHRRGLCAREAGLHTPVPLLEGVVEIPQRKCRDCREVMVLDRFDGAARSCSGCTRKRTGGPRSELGDCPACGELCRVPKLREIPGHRLLACESCVAEHRNGGAIDVAVAR